MNGHHPELEAAVTQALAPTWTEIVRAKRALSELLADGKPHGIRTLQSCLLDIDGIPREAAHRERLELASPDDIALVVTPSHPILARQRLAWAASESLVDLVAQGILVEIADPPLQDGRHPLIAGEVIVQYQLGGHGAGIRHPTLLPRLSPAYRLSPRLARHDNPWFIDPDIFSTDLEQLPLDTRTRRCVAEALASYRKGLFLACASLLGAASEGAWYAAGEQLRHIDRRLATALDDGRTAVVVARVGEVLRQGRGRRDVVDELQAHAALLRQLRNYGVHPRATQTAHLERYFDDAGAAVLLLETHSYLTRLAAAVAARLDPANAPSAD
jgi:hypothetical protein